MEKNYDLEQEQEEARELYWELKRLDDGFLRSRPISQEETKDTKHIISEGKSAYESEMIQKRSLLK